MGTSTKQKKGDIMSYERDYIHAYLNGVTAAELVENLIDKAIDDINDEIGNISFCYNKYTWGGGQPYNPNDARLVNSCLEQKEQLLKVLAGVQSIKENM